MMTKEEGNLFRESFVRYTAFASDFGEALKPFIGKRMYVGSYAIVAAYGLADTLDRGIKAQNKLKNSQPACRAAPPRPHHPRKLLAAIPPPGPLPPLNPVAATMAESLIWHTAASLIIPGVIINRTVWATGRLICTLQGLSPGMRHALPTLAGLATIPLIVPHIDGAVTRWVDAHVAPHLTRAAQQRQEKCNASAYMRRAHS